jgi:hypothetical protein
MASDHFCLVCLLQTLLQHFISIRLLNQCVAGLPDAIFSYQFGYILEGLRMENIVTFHDHILGPFGTYLESFGIF